MRANGIGKAETKNVEKKDRNRKCRNKKDRKNRSKERIRSEQNVEKLEDYINKQFNLKLYPIGSQRYLYDVVADCSLYGTTITIEERMIVVKQKQSSEEFYF